MPAWKVLFIGLCGCICLALATATFIVPFSFDGGERWLWLGGLLAATAAAGTLFALFLRHAGSSLDAKPARR
ncbi:MAG: hypothetical protein U0871_07770 [Gemmataceae bacterium]